MRRRLRSTIKWSCTVLTVLLLVVWITSAWWGFGCLVRRTTLAGVYGGTVFVRYENSNMLADLVATGELPLPVWRHDANMEWSFHWKTYTSSASGLLLRRDVSVPIWPALLVLGIPACYLCYRDARRHWRQRHGHCPACNYDLRATTTGTCPECGAVIYSLSSVA